MKKALQIKKAAEAVDAEWEKLAKKKAWLLETVQPKAKVIARAKAKGAVFRICCSQARQLCSRVRID